MSIIIKKKKGFFAATTPKPPTPAQILGSVGINSILGTTYINQKDFFDDSIEEAIQQLITEKMLLLSTRIIRSLEYFVSYRMVNGKKEIKTLFLKKQNWLKFIRVDHSEMILTGGHPKEFLSFLEKKKCKKIKISREQLENQI
tara:strand:+ start:919 stop:1347 length:429 start_codon:yes stop_codon:yes gene_type:complete